MRTHSPLGPLTQLMRTNLGRPELGSFTLQKAYITFPLLSSSTISSRPPSVESQGESEVAQWPVLAPSSLGQEIQVASKPGLSESPVSESGSWAWPTEVQETQGSGGFSPYMSINTTSTDPFITSEIKMSFHYKSDTRFPNGGALPHFTLVWTPQRVLE